MKTLSLILIGIGSLFACVKKSTPVAVAVPVIINTNPPGNMPPVAPADSLSYLALGDSYTIGQSVNPKSSFPYQLSVKLNAYGLQKPAIIAQTGWTADNLITAIGASGVTGKKYDVVTLLIGVNDQYQGLSQANYRVKFVQLLNTAISFAKNKASRVFVLSIPDYGVTPYANGQDAIIGPQIDEFNNINREESIKAGVNYVNITTISKQAGNNFNLLANDGLHPSALQYAQWVEVLSPVVIGVVKK
jgi:lysophospholipase L1-like esterase